MSHSRNTKSAPTNTRYLHVLVMILGLSNLPIPYLLSLTLINVHSDDAKSAPKVGFIPKVRLATSDI